MSGVSVGGQACKIVSWDIAEFAWGKNARQSNLQSYKPDPQHSIVILDSSKDLPYMIQCLNADRLNPKHTQKREVQLCICNSRREIIHRDSQVDEEFIKDFHTSSSKAF